MVQELPTSRKLQVLFRVEPGCMGPAGIDHIDEFCQYANEHIVTLNQHYVAWTIVARMNKKLPETEYRVANKLLTESQVDKYLAVFGSSLDDFEEQTNERLAEMVDEFWTADPSRGEGSL